MMTRNEMIEQLRAKECRITFTKVDGELRNMKCTLMETVLPAKVTEAEAIDTSKPRKVNLNTVVAWDVEKEAFRSFRVENVVSFD